MITVTITAVGGTVAEALANARSIAHPPHPVHQQILDGEPRPVYRGGSDDPLNRIGTISATTDSDSDAEEHYTGKWL